MIKGFMVNKFRGDPTLFDDGYKQIEDFTGWQELWRLAVFQECLETSR